MKYIVAFSGGVDSTVVILKLLEEGHQVSAAVMDWIPDEIPASTHARRVIRKACDKAARLNIPCSVIDIKREFEEKVIEYFIDTYLSGRTPNPCAICNRFIKFGIFLEKSLAPGTILATGHYAAITHCGDNLCIRRAKEPRIEQSYFLTLVRPEVLPHIRFPLANMTRREVEEYLKARGEEVPEKSQEICFVDNKFWELIEKKAHGKKKGWIIGPDGEKLREITDFYRYTVGQRKGLRVAYGAPLYVAHIDPRSGNVYTTTKDKLGWTNMTIGKCNWFKNPEPEREYLVQIRYRTPPSAGRVISMGEKCTIRLERPQVIVPGQVAAIYDGETLLGGGIIEERW